MAQITQGVATATPMQAQAVFREPILFFASPQLVANGTSSVERTLTLARNAVVEPPFTVTVQAGSAEWTRGKDVGLLRQQDISYRDPTDATKNQARSSVVLDFGTLRTVSGLAVTNTLKFQILQAKQWTGLGFADAPIFSMPNTPSKIGPSIGRLTGDSRAAVPFPSQVRTERLQIDLVGKENDTVLGEWLLIQLPDLPADLELRINGNPPVWTSPGPVTSTARGWHPAANGLMEQTVEISQALTALLGDPTAPKAPTVDLHIVLSARVPGALALDLPGPGAPTIRYITQVAQDFPDGKRELKFAEEGLISVPLTLPAWAKTVERVKFTVSANLPPERVIPAVGPDPTSITLNGVVKPLAEMVLDPDHAACVALEETHELIQLTAVRLPLRAEAGGAEVRVLLLGPDARGQPGPPVDGGASKPAMLEAASGPGEAWTSFSFARPVPLDEAKLPFVAVIVGRGRVAWALTEVPGAGTVRRGPPAGPWQELPAVGELALLRGRVRLVGHAGRDRPVAPLQIHLSGASAEPKNVTNVTPTPKGIAAEIQASSPLPVGPSHTVDLKVISLVAGTVTLRDVLVIVTDA